MNPPQIVSYNSYGIQCSTEPEKNSLIGLVPRQNCLGNYIYRIVRMGAAVNRLIDNIHSVTLISETLQADNTGSNGAVPLFLPGFTQNEQEAGQISVISCSFNSQRPDHFHASVARSGRSFI